MMTEDAREIMLAIERLTDAVDRLVAVAAAGVFTADTTESVLSAAEYRALVELFHAVLPKTTAP